MKKYLFSLIASAAMLGACKKNEPADALVATPSDPVSATETTPATSPVPGNETLLADAKGRPVTNVALSENFFDFGKIKKGDHVKHTYEITNTGKNPLVISSVKPGCGCTAPEFTKEPILPGKKGEITLAFDSSNFDGLVNKQAEVFANVEKAPITITFSANIQP